MVKKSVLPKETTMYSVHKETGDIIVHHLPWERGNPQLEHYERKGFTYERPRLEAHIARVEGLLKDTAVLVTEESAVLDMKRGVCPTCGKPCKPQGLKAHMRACKKVKS